MMDNRNMRRQGRTTCLLRLTPTCVLLCSLLGMVFCLAQSASAKSPVTARYLEISEDAIRLRLIIGSPCPQNLILEQYLPPGTTILSASPSIRQTNSRSGVAKWLFRRVSPGEIDVTMRVSPAKAAREVRGTLRYRMPGGERMSELRISP